MAAHQAPLSLGFSREEYWSGLPFPSPMHACMLSRFSRVWLSETLWTAAHQAPLSTGFSRQEYWSGLPFPSPSAFILDSLKSRECHPTLSGLLPSLIHCNGYHQGCKQPPQANQNEQFSAPVLSYPSVVLMRAYIGMSHSTLCDPIDCSPPGSSVHGDSRGKNTAVGCHALLQGGLPHPGIETASLTSPALQCRRVFFFFFFTTGDTREAPAVVTVVASLSLLKPSLLPASVISGSLGFLLCLAVSVTLAGSFLSTQSFYLSLY